VKPGIPLNRKVAELLGWTDLEEVKQVHRSDLILQGVKPGERASIYTGYKPKFHVPDFSGDTSAAFELIPEMVTNFRHDPISQGFGFGFKLEYCTESSEDKWLCILPWTTCSPPFEEMDPSRVLGEGNTAPHAICLAFVKAMEEKA
jgi:hypothetical protein